MNRFVPSSTYSPLSRRATVRIAAESEPEPASVSAYAASTSPDASRGSQAARCSSEPPSLSPSEPSSCTARMSPLVAQTFETSSIATSESSVPVPVPPTSSAKKSPKIPWSRKSSTTSHGNSCDASISAARGAIRSRATVRTSSRSSRCSSLRTSQGTGRSLGRRAVSQQLRRRRRRLQGSAPPQAEDPSRTFLLRTGQASISAGTNLLTSTILSAGTFARRAASMIASGDGAS